MDLSSYSPTHLVRVSRQYLLILINIYLLTFTIDDEAQKKEKGDGTRHGKHKLIACSVCGVIKTSEYVI